MATPETFVTNICVDPIPTGWEIVVNKDGLMILRELPIEISEVSSTNNTVDPMPTLLPIIGNLNKFVDVDPDPIVIDVGPTPITSAFIISDSDPIVTELPIDTPDVSLTKIISDPRPTVELTFEIVEIFTFEVYSKGEIVAIPTKNEVDWIVSAENTDPPTTVP